MNGSHVLAFVIGAGAILACQLFAALLLGKRKVIPSAEVADWIEQNADSQCDCQLCQWHRQAKKDMPEPWRGKQ